MIKESDQVRVEILDSGFILHYMEPVKRMRNPYATEGYVKLLITFVPDLLKEYIDKYSEPLDCEVDCGHTPEEHEEWIAADQKKVGILKSIQTQMEPLIDPKPVEEWTWTQKRIVVPSSADLPAALESAQKARRIGKDLEAAGTHVRMDYNGQLGDYLGRAPLGEAFAAAPVPTPVDPSIFNS